MNWKHCFASAVIALTVFAGSVPVFAAPAQKKPEPVTIVASTDKKDAIYKAGEEITLTLGIQDNNKTPKTKFMTCELFVDGKRVKKETVPADKPHTFKITLDKPGWVAAFAAALDQNKKRIERVTPKGKWNRYVRDGIGAMVDPEKIQPAAPEPEDFVSYWKEQRAALDKVPVKATRVAVPLSKSYDGKVVLFDVKVDCAGNAPVSGYLAMPANAKAKSLPAIVFYHGAGVRSSIRQRGYGKKAIAFDVNAHGIENGKDAAFYSDLAEGKLKGYQSFGKNNRDTFYFHDMYLRVMRALDYVKSLPEWDGKTLIVRGGSQGGGQSLVAAGLDHDVTLCVANVPALGDHAGWTVGRKPGWPGLYQVKDGKIADEATAKAAHYYDNNNFARHIQCPTWLSTGFIDFVCAPTSVYSVYNTLKVEKHIDTTPDAGHESPIPSGIQELNKTINRK